MTRPSLPIVFAISLCAAAAGAQSNCPYNNGTIYAYRVIVSPASPMAGQPFALSVPICNGLVPASAGIPISVTLANDLTNVNVYEGEAPTDASGIASFNVNPGLPGGLYDYSVTSTSQPFVGGYGGITVYFPPIHALLGQYAFLFQGRTTAASAPGAAVQSAMAGSFTADGNGNITSGVADLNTPQGVTEQLAVTGSYTLAADGTGTMTLVTSASAQTFALYVSPPYATTEVLGAAFTSTGDGPFNGSGSLKALDMTAPFTSSFILALNGETACNGTCVAAGGQAQSASVTGFLELTNGSPPGFTTLFDEAFGTTSVVGLTQSGTRSDADSNYRSVLTLTSGFIDGQPTRFALYGYAPDDTLYLISLDPHDQTALVSGSGVQP